MSQGEVKKSLHELKVNELRNELERRGMDKSGIKATLIDRLDQALKAEGHDVQTYRFGMSELQQSTQQQLNGDKPEAFAADDAVLPIETIMNDTNGGGEFSSSLAAADTLALKGDANGGAKGGENDVKIETKSVLNDANDDGGDTDEQQKTQELENDTTYDDNETFKMFMGKNLCKPVTVTLMRMFDTLNLNTEEFDERAVEMLATFPVEQANFILKELKDSQLFGVQNKPQYLMSVMRNFRERLQTMSVQQAMELPLNPGPDPERVEESITKSGRQLEVTVDQRKCHSSSDCKEPGPSQSDGGCVKDRRNDVVVDQTPSVQVAAAVAFADLQPQQLLETNNENGKNSGDNVSDHGNSSDDVILINEEQQAQSKVKESPPKQQINNGANDDGEKRSAFATSAHSVDGKSDLSSSLWIRNITTTTKAADLKAQFSKHGKVITAKIFTTKNKQSPTCFGYVTLADAETANVCAHKLNRSNFKGRIINVEKADRSNLSQIGTQHQTSTTGTVAKASGGGGKAVGSSSGGTSSSKSATGGGGAEPSASTSSSSSKKVRPRITAVTESPTTQRHRSSSTTKAAASSSRTSIKKRIAKNGDGGGGGGSSGGGTTSKYDSLSRQQPQRRYFRSRVASAAFGYRAAAGMDGAAAPQYIIKSRHPAESRRYIYSRVVQQTSRGVRVLTHHQQQYGEVQQQGGGFRDFSSRRGVPTGSDSRRFGGGVSAGGSGGNDEREQMLRLMEQREEEHRKKEEELRLEREREKLKYEREKLERERLEVEHMKLAAQIQASGWLQTPTLPVVGGFAAPLGGAVAGGFVGQTAAIAANTTGGGGSRSQQYAGGDSRQLHSRHHNDAAAPTRSSAKKDSSKSSTSATSRSSAVGRVKELSSRSRHDAHRASSDRDRATTAHRHTRSRSRSPIHRSSTRSGKDNTGSSSSAWQPRGGGGSSAASRFVGKQRDGGGGRGNSRGGGGGGMSSQHHQPSSYGQQQLGGGTTMNPFSQQQQQPFGGGSSTTGGVALSYEKQHQQYSMGGGASSRMTSSSSAAVSATGGGGYDRHGQFQGRSYYNDRYADAQQSVNASYASRTDPSYGQRIVQFSGSNSIGGGVARDEMYGVGSSGGGSGGTFDGSGFDTQSTHYGSSRGQSSGAGQPSSSSYYNSQSAWANSAGTVRASDMVNARAFNTGAASSAGGGSWNRQTDDILSEWNMYSSPSKMAGTSSSSARYHQQSLSYGGGGGGSRSGGGGGSLYSGGGGGGGTRRY